MLLDVSDAETITLLQRYVAVLAVPHERLRATTDRRTFERWLGRRLSGTVGGAYVSMPDRDQHAILINLERIDRTRPRAVEVVVAEELIHFRDALDGDRRRHAKHGYDRIAVRVAEVTGASLAEIRAALMPVVRRPFRYVYTCATCGRRILRRVRGTWSCGRCSARFDRRFVLRLELELAPVPAASISI
jgi:predicted SprT family Zn-dependent metalloprotease